MADDITRDIVERALADGGGILRLEAAWVAREWTQPGRRLGLPEERVVVGERGWICERWLGSTTTADHRIGPDDEGLSYLALEGGHRITLRDAVRRCRRRIMGTEYAATPSWPRSGWPRSSTSIRASRSTCTPGSSTPRSWAATRRTRPTGTRPDVDMGPHPESFFGLHASTLEPQNHERLLPYLIDWDSDRILEQSTGLLPGRRGRLPHPIGRAARAWYRAHLRAAGGLGRPAHVPGAQRRQDRLPGPDVQGRPARGPGALRRALPARDRGLGSQLRPVLLREPSPGTLPRRWPPGSPAARSTGSTTTR